MLASLAGRARPQQQLLDMRDRRVGQDAVAEIEHMRALGESGKDPVDRGVERRAAGDQRERIEIALHRQVRGQRGMRPDRIDGLVDADRIDAVSRA
jgi:hypothetical protein